MLPYLFGISWVHTYGLCVLVGVVLAWLLARVLARRAGVEVSEIDLLLPVAAGMGIFGAYVFGWMTRVVGGGEGTVLFGSLLLATVGGIGYAVMRRIRLGVLGDVVAGPIAVGIACGRVGCFCAGCCYGEVAHGMGVSFPRYSFAWEHQRALGLIGEAAACSLAVHPVQLYEAALMVGLAIVLTRGFSRRRVSGELFLWLGMGYGVVRFGMEFLRADNPAVMGGLTFSQVVSVGVVLAAGVTMMVRRGMKGRWGLAVGGAVETGVAVQTGG